jgi:pyruvate formate lyase activating enzyme
LYTLIYNRVSSLSANPIEKKPLFHLYPGSLCFSMGTLGCNFRCPGCQNWEISHAIIKESDTMTEKITPEESIKLSFQYRCQGISWTFNEPTIWFEYTLDGARLAKEKGLYTAYVTNGFITPEALEMISPYLDAFRVDIKGFSEETYKKISSVNALSGVLDSLKLAKYKYNMHVECVTNVTPDINDNEDELKEMAKWIKNELSPDTPWHVTRFYPHLDLSHIPITSLSKLERIRQIGFDMGLRYVYLGNVPGHHGENTYCYNCKELLIERYGFSVTRFNIKDNRCPKCNVIIFGSFTTIKRAF